MPSLGIGIGLPRLSQRTIGGGFTGLLDTYGGAAAAYSLRALSSAFQSSAVVRVRRSSDSTEQNFTAAEITDGTLTTFTGAGDGFVSTWYDQSGNGRNATQTNAPSQTQIVSSGSLVAGGIDFLTTSFFDTTHTASTQISFFSVCTPNDDGSTNILIDARDGAGDGFLVASKPGGWELRYNALTASGSGTISSELLISGVCKSGSQTVRQNGGGIISGTTAGDLAVTTTSDIGSRNFSTTASQWGGKVRELIIYDTDQTANLAAIEAAMNSAYSIY